MVVALNFGEILREFGEILGKYRILDGRSPGSIWLNKNSWFPPNEPYPQDHQIQKLWR